MHVDAALPLRSLLATLGKRASRAKGSIPIERSEAGARQSEGTFQISKSGRSQEGAQHRQAWDPHLTFTKKHFLNFTRAQFGAQVWGSDLHPRPKPDVCCVRHIGRFLTPLDIPVFSCHLGRILLNPGRVFNETACVNARGLDDSS